MNPTIVGGYKRFLKETMHARRRLAEAASLAASVAETSTRKFEAVPKNLALALQEIKKCPSGQEANKGERYDCWVKELGFSVETPTANN